MYRRQKGFIMNRESVMMIAWLPRLIIGPRLCVPRFIPDFSGRVAAAKPGSCCGMVVVTRFFAVNGIVGCF